MCPHSTNQPPFHIKRIFYMYTFFYRTSFPGEFIKRNVSGIVTYCDSHTQNVYWYYKSSASWFMDVISFYFFSFFHCLTRSLLQLFTRFATENKNKRQKRQCRPPPPPSAFDIRTIWWNFNYYSSIKWRCHFSSQHHDHQSDIQHIGAQLRMKY